jgi:hypothetical protein
MYSTGTYLSGTEVGGAKKHIPEWIELHIWSVQFPVVSLGQAAVLNISRTGLDHSSTLLTKQANTYSVPYLF